MIEPSAKHRLKVLASGPSAAALAWLDGADDADADGAELALPPELIDGFARRVTYLRVSLTDRCNYRCTYCMPEEGVTLLPREDVLDFEEIERLVRVFVRLGVSRVRLTGGEPTVRRDLIQLVTRLAALPGLDDLSLSTNGERLLELAEPLRAAGLARLNVSVDSLDPTRFRALTRRGDLGRVLAGLELAASLGFRAIKTNTVALRGFNHDELGALCLWAWQRGIVPRFIEEMPMAGGQLFVPGEFLPAADIRAGIAAQAGTPGEELEPDLAEGPEGASTAHRGGGPARYYRLTSRGSSARVGIISPVTEQFCDTCNRVRLDAVGRLHACLGHDDATSLRDLLRAKASDGQLARAIVVNLLGKRQGHDFTALGCGAPSRAMVSIGG